MSELILSRRDINFLLFEWLQVDRLGARPRFAAHDRFAYEATLDVYEALARDLFAPHNKKNDSVEPRFDGERVIVNPEVGVALRGFADAGLNTRRLVDGRGAALVSGGPLSTTWCLLARAHGATLVRGQREVSRELTLPGSRRGDFVGGDGNGAAALSDMLNCEGDLLGGSQLLSVSGADLAARLADFPHDRQPVLHLLGALLEDHDRLAALRLGVLDERGDLGGGSLGALSQPSHLVGHDGKASTGFARARGFDRGVEGQEVGLVCDVADELENAVDLVDATGQGQRAITRRPEVGLRHLHAGSSFGTLGGDPHH